MKRAWKEENSGEIMLETSIIFVIVLTMLFVLLSMGFLYYQKVMLVAAAEDLAANLASSYKYTSVSVSDREYSATDTNNINMYRTTFSIRKMEQQHKTRGNAYVKMRVAKTSLGIEDGDAVIESIDVCRDGIGRVHIEVTISQKSEFFLSGVLEMVGISEVAPTFTATASAQCIDITGYASAVNLTRRIGEETADLNGIAEIVDDVKEIIEILK